ncbi:hypothetical protein GUJ93_ZPchr0009g2102 [Zizania palustris]|uniref:Solute carrier family 40 member n=1 Tax=Zizania palustris TaxID=103762 RepID=A0A8J5RMF1_ZIZPA|nr:hypothetical protein GUJ93_ZPchr0009g2102 [Zizania palustris]
MRGLKVASRLGHMAYSAIGLQVVQMGNPAGKAKLIGTTEIAVASLAELAMAAQVPELSPHVSIVDVMDTTPMGRSSSPLTHMAQNHWCGSRGLPQTP